MGYQFSAISKERLNTCHKRLQYLCDLVLSLGVMEFQIVEGHRLEKRHLELMREVPPRTKVPWEKSKHSRLPSHAVDIIPIINGKASYDVRHCLVLGGAFVATAAMTGIGLRWGGNWDRDGEPITDQGFNDLVHFELWGDDFE